MYVCVYIYIYICIQIPARRLSAVRRVPQQGRWKEKRPQLSHHRAEQRHGVRRVVSKFEAQNVQICAACASMQHRAGEGGRVPKRS